MQIEKAFTLQTFELCGMKARAYSIPIGKNLNIVFVESKSGIVGCGAIDPEGLEKFGYAAAKIKPAGESVSSIEDLLNGTVAAVNASGEKLGITIGMKGEDAVKYILD